MTAAKLTAAASDLVQEVLWVEMRPVDVAGVHRHRLFVGLSFLVQPIVELQHSVHPSPPVGPGSIWPLRRTVRIRVHGLKATGGKMTSCNAGKQS